MGTKGALTEKEAKLNLGVVKFSDATTYSSDKFTDVHCLYTSTIFEGSDIDISLAEYKINAGESADFEFIAPTDFN